MLHYPLLFTVLLAVSFPALAEPNPAGAVGDLQEIQQTISATQKDLNQKQAAQKSTQATLDKTRNALNKAQQELNKLDQQQQQTWQKFQTLQNALGKLKTEVTGTKAQVARLLSGHYKNRQPNAVMLFLKNAEPSQKTRYLQYARYINQANEKVIGQLAQQQKELSVQEHNIEAQLERLKKLKTQKQHAMSKLGRDNAAAQKISNNLSVDIERQSKRIASLKTDEQRLNNILAEITKRQALQRKKEAAARSKAAQSRITAANQARAAAAQAKKNKQSTKKQVNKTASTTPNKATSRKNTQISAPHSTLTTEDRNLQSPTGTIEPIRTSFSRMQGQMRKPTGGNISGGFGQARPSGGIWKGIFIATGPSSVQSIAAGTVAYAAYLQGYGNTVIVDHGDSYLSVYAGLNNLNVSSGSQVAARQNIGTSGTLPDGEQGLYFEVRYRNQAMNPLSWVR